MDIPSSIRRPLVVRSLLSAFFYLVLATAAFGMLPIDNSLIMDLRVSLTREDFLAIVEGQYHGCRDCYLVFHLVDFLFILCFYPLVARFATRLCTTIPIPSLMAYAAGLSDLVENLAVDAALLMFPNTPWWIYPVVRVATPLKFTLLVLSLASMLLCRLRHFMHSR